MGMGGLVQSQTFFSDRLAISRFSKQKNATTLTWTRHPSVYIRQRGAILSKQSFINQIIHKTFAWRSVNGGHLLMTCFVILLGLFSLFYGEIVPANDGLGWDGATYADLTRNLPSIISDGKLNTYYAQRWLPSALVRIFLIMFKSAFSNDDIIHAFAIYNLVLLGGACFIWKRIADRCNLSVSGRWLGFSGLFLSFQCSKQSFYYPVLTDVTALFVGMLLLLFFIEKRPLAILFTAIVGAFAWPVVGFSGAILLVFLKSEFSEESVLPKLYCKLFPNSVIHLWSKRAVLFSIGFSLTGLFFLVSWEQLLQGESSIYKIPNILGLQRLFTGIPSLVAVGGALVMLVGSVSCLKEAGMLLKKCDLKLAVFAVASIIIPWAVVSFISNPLLPNPSGLVLFATLMLLPPNGKIMLSFVSICVFWGPFILLLLLRWNKFCVVARKLGPGFLGIIGISLPLILVTEPRFITSAWPFFVLGGVLVFEEIKVRDSFKYLFAVMTLLFSQFWLKINIAPWTKEIYDGLGDFPKQLYFMHYGFFMSWPSYLAQFLLVTIFIVVIHFSIRANSIGNTPNEFANPSKLDQKLNRPNL